MDALRRSRTGEQRILAWTWLIVGLALALALVGSLVVASAASSATVSSAWQAKIGARGANGTAKVQVFTTGTGALTIRLMKMRPATLLPVVLHKGTCGAVGPVIARIASVRSSNAGVANWTTSLTVTRVRAIVAAAGSGKVAIRIGSGSALRCGPFSTLPIATPSPSSSASPSGSPSASPSSSPSDPRLPRPRRRRHLRRRRPPGADPAVRAPAPGPGDEPAARLTAFLPQAPHRQSGGRSPLAGLATAAYGDPGPRLRARLPFRLRPERGRR